ncbi:MAG: hypothetical protein AXW14_00345 [Alteromonas sp. Nap_26]|nr:MAG: hypothetical protein AXW14_00345 [Alteromonas sp. Nap_26]
MDYQFNKTLFFMLTVIFCLGILSACGGGGGSNSSAPSETPAPAPAPVPNDPDENEDENYLPDETGLDNEANNSEQLYIQPDFTFDTHKVITLDISAINADGRAIGNALMFISVVDSDINELTDERLQQKALLTVARTNANGEVLREVEIANTATKLLIELNTVGIENEVLVTLADDNYVSYQFN